MTNISKMLKRKNRFILTIVFAAVLPLGILFQNATVLNTELVYEQLLDFSKEYPEITFLGSGSNSLAIQVGNTVYKIVLAGPEARDILVEYHNELAYEFPEITPKVEKIGDYGFSQEFSKGISIDDLSTVKAQVTAAVDMATALDAANDIMGIKWFGSRLKFDQNINLGNGFLIRIDENSANFRFNPDGTIKSWFDPIFVMTNKSISPTDEQLADFKTRLQNQVIQSYLDDATNVISNSGNFGPNSQSAPIVNALSGSLASVNGTSGNGGASNGVSSASSVNAVGLSTIALGLLSMAPGISNAGQLAANLKNATTDTGRSQIFNRSISDYGKGLKWGAIVTFGSRAIVTVGAALGAGTSAGAGVSLLIVAGTAAQLSDKNFWMGYANYILDPKSAFTASAKAVSIGFGAAGTLASAATQVAWWKLTSKNFMDRIKDQLLNDKQTDWTALANTDGKTLAKLVNKALEATMWQNDPNSSGSRNINDGQSQKSEDFVNNPINFGSENSSGGSAGTTSSTANNQGDRTPAGDNGNINNNSIASSNFQYVPIDINIPSGLGVVQQGNNSTIFTANFPLSTPNNILSVPDGKGGVILFDPSKGSPVAALPNLNSGNIASPGLLTLDPPPPPSPPPVAPPIVTPKPPPSQNIQTNSNSAYTTKINNSDGSLSYQITVQNKSDGSSSVTWQSYTYDKSGKLTSTTVDTTNYKSNRDYTNTNTTSFGRPISLAPSSPKLDDGKPKETCTTAACRSLNNIPNSNKLGADTKKTIEDSNGNKTGAVSALPTMVFGEEVNE